MTTIRATMAQALVRYLAAQKVERDGEARPFFAGMFGIFGHGNVTGIGQALEEHRDLLRYYRPQNEQAMVHTAAAYAKATNRLGTFACTSSVGPGATNMVTGAALATVNRLPVLLLPGDTFANRAPHPVLQQLEYTLAGDVSANDTFRPVSKFFDRIVRPDQLLMSLPEAMRVLIDPAETGAVTLAMPEDTQTEAFDYPASFFEERVWKIRRPVPPQDALEEAARLISNSENPLIIAGGGVIYSGASDALDDFATEFGIPVSESQAGKGAIPWDHVWNIGPIGANGGFAANRIASDADVIIAIGTRLGDFVTASKTAFQNPNARFIGINVAGMDAHKMGAVPLTGDAWATLEALGEVLRAEGTVRDIYATGKPVQDLKREWEAEVDRLCAIEGDGEKLSQAQVLGLVNEAAGDHGTVINAAGSMPGDLLKLWRARDPKGYHVEYGYSCMGYEIPAGLGVKLADPGREVFVMIGDGSYLMLHTEIVTAVQEGVKFVVVVVDNHGFQSIHGLQMGSGTPSFGNELRYRSEGGVLDGPPVPVDFATNAESLGARAIRATTADELREALVEAKTESRVTVVTVEVDPEPRVPNYEGWWDVPIAEVSDEPSVNDARAEYDEAIKQQRVVW
ncbi:MAG TPA: 3D-(3,5/4)-trihydroxycyclohexane-1,2-dione acylhydrolase (decyclizing) [Thermomicrobiales bacterium]|nr:3D-(3,5/4)-trihydroxycyclohexane-1,2-dione acylhydrolase (decyclizing) [Thermomicrobiales bacterium]